MKLFILSIMEMKSKHRITTTNWNFSHPIINISKKANNKLDFSQIWWTEKNIEKLWCENIIYSK